MGTGTKAAIGAGCALVVLTSTCCVAYGVWFQLLAPASVDDPYLAAVDPVDVALATGGTPDPTLVASLAADRVSRAYLWDVLEAYGREDLLPPEHATLEARGEADLARWLVFPTELDTAPAEMSLAARAFLVDPALGEVQYFAFRFHAPPGHWSDGMGWMFGIAGPWPLAPGSTFEGAGMATYSELAPYTDDGFRELVARMHAEAISFAPVPTSSVRVEIVPLR